jgi:hypothetical protein
MADKTVRLHLGAAGTVSRKRALLMCNAAALFGRMIPMIAAAF